MDSSRSTTQAPFSEPGWALALLVIAMVATPVVAATIAVEGVIGRAFGDRQDNRDQGLDPVKGDDMTGTAARAEGPQRLGVQAGGTAACAIGITKTHGRGVAAVTALDRVSVAFGRGRFTAVMGPSGSGKSTLLHCLAGLDTVDSGTVRIGDTDLTTLDERRLTRLRREHVGFVFQSYNLLPTLTAEENLELPLAIAGRKPDRAWIDRVIDAVGLRARLRHRPGELSGGEQQRVAAARALASRPTVVFADEPTGNLDSRASAELLEFLRRSVDELEQTIVMVTHDPVAAGHADEALFLADGRVVDAISRPTAARVLDRIKALGSSGGGAAADLRGPSSAEGG